MLYVSSVNQNQNLKSTIFLKRCFNVDIFFALSVFRHTEV